MPKDWRGWRSMTEAAMGGDPPRCGDIATYQLLVVS
jgi:hypothetical protein